MVPDILSLKQGEMQEIHNAFTPAVSFHEAGHVLGGTRGEHLANYVNPVEECSAESNSPALAEKMAPHLLKGLILEKVAYGPIWMTIGLKGAHQKAELYIVGRLMQEGAVTVDGNAGKLEADTSLALPIFKQIAEECLILEKPDALKAKAQILLAPELAKLEAEGRPGDLGVAAFMRAEKMFGDEAINSVAEKLMPVAKKILGKPIPFAHFAYLEDPLNKRI